MAVRRKLFVVWIALVLNALAPVFAYTHIQLGENGEILEHCVTDEGDSPGDHHHHHPDSKKSAAPHCVYCPGFSAGAAFASIASVPPRPCVEPAPLVFAPIAVPSGRSSIRIAHQRAPPTAS